VTCPEGLEGLDGFANRSAGISLYAHVWSRWPRHRKIKVAKLGLQAKPNRISQGFPRVLSDQFCGGTNMHVPLGTFYMVLGLVQIPNGNT
jgi:hypothetical protein